MVAMNKVMDPQKTAQTMREFERQNAKMEMTEEMSKLHANSTFYVRVVMLREIISSILSMVYKKYTSVLKWPPAETNRSCQLSIDKHDQQRTQLVIFFQ